MLFMVFHRKERKEKTSLRFWREAFIKRDNPSYGVINKDPTLARNLSMLGLLGYQSRC